MEVWAVVRSVFVEIPSKRSFAIAKPTECREVIHLECGNEEYGSTPEKALSGD